MPYKGWCSFPLTTFIFLNSKVSKVLSSLLVVFHHCFRWDSNQEPPDNTVTIQPWCVIQITRGHVKTSWSNLSVCFLTTSFSRTMCTKCVHIHTATDSRRSSNTECLQINKLITVQVVHLLYFDSVLLLCWHYWRIPIGLLMIPSIDQPKKKWK